MASHHDGRLLVTGASGHLGRLVLEGLLADPHLHGRKIVASTRTADKLADFAKRGVEVRTGSFDDPASLKGVFEGVGRALIISTDALDRPGRRVEQHKNAIDAAKAAGVEHIVYTSLPNPGPESLVAIAPDHFHTEAAIRASGLSHAILRNNLYSEYLVPGLQHAVKTGKLINASGDGATSYVTREDCAAAAAGALLSAFTGKRAVDITGPAAITQAELATIASEVTGKLIEYVAVDGDAARSGLTAAGLPPEIAGLLVSFQLSIAKGQLAVVSSAVKELSGKSPTSVREFLVSKKAALI